MAPSHYYHTLTIFITFIGLCYGEGVLPDTEYGAVEGNVTFTTSLTATSTPYTIITWTVNSSNILTYKQSGIDFSPAYQSRVTLNASTGSLELRNLTMKDRGTYSVNIVPTTGPALSGNTVLQVLEQVSNVVIKASASDVVEFNSSVSLSCSSSGSSPSYHWLNGSSEVTASDNIQLGDGGSTLTIVNVTRYDQGPWRCNVTNRVSNDISQPFNITIYYGPEDTVVEVNPPGGLYVAGSALSLSCSAHSKPVAQYHWFLNGTQLSNEGPVLQLVNIQTSQSGSYICQAFNTRTLRYVSSEPSIISVWEKVADVSINPSSQPITEGMCVNLTCAAAGSISTREWMKDGVPLSPSDRVSFSGDNSTVSISPVNRTDNGEYLCRVTNPVSSQDAKYNMIVNSEGSLTERGLSGGAIAGIVIKVLVIVGVTVGLTVYLIKKENKTKGSLGAGRETERKHTQQNQASHDRGHDNIQFSLHEPTIKTSRDPQERKNTPDSRNCDQTYENVPDPTTRVVEAPPVLPRESEYEMPS